MTPKTHRKSEADGIYADMPTKEQKRLILCFDGTGDQYRADTSDTNVVKLYEKFDRQDPCQYHYYQREFAFRVTFCGYYSIQTSRTTNGRLSRVNQLTEPKHLLLTSVSP